MPPGAVLSRGRAREFITPPRVCGAATPPPPVTGRFVRGGGEKCVRSATTIGASSCSRRERHARDWTRRRVRLFVSSPRRRTGRSAEIRDPEVLGGGGEARGTLYNNDRGLERAGTGSEGGKRDAPTTATTITAGGNEGLMGGGWEERERFRSIRVDAPRRKIKRLFG